MNIQYYKAAWGDLRNSPGWFGKLCLLALLNLVPVFGQIVTYGYLYGWAREIAWGTHEPMPAKIFQNDDGKFWRRGWFVFVLALVFAFVPQLIMMCGDALQNAGIGGYRYSSLNGYSVSNPALYSIGSVVALLAWLLAIVCNVLSWIGSMRVSLYDRLSAGFQLGKIWKMARHDANGLLRIFGMSLLVSLIISLVLTVIITVLVLIVVFVGVAGLVGAGYSVESLQSMSDIQMMHVVAQFFVSAGVIGIIALVAIVFFMLVAVVFVDALVIRAMGYWTMQFDVARWGGQDEPLPFENANVGQ